MDYKFSRTSCDKCGRDWDLCDKVIHISAELCETQVYKEQMICHPCWIFKDLKFEDI